MSKSIKITLSDESAFYLDWLTDQQHITVKNRNSVIVQQLIHQAVQRYKVADRPVWEGEKK